MPIIVQLKMIYIWHPVNTQDLHMHHELKPLSWLRKPLNQTMAYKTLSPNAVSDQRIRTSMESYWVKPGSNADADEDWAVMGSPGNIKLWIMSSRGFRWNIRSLIVKSLLTRHIVYRVDKGPFNLTRSNKPKNTPYFREKRKYHTSQFLIFSD